MKHLKYLKDYDEGRITWHELAYCLMKIIAPENVEEILSTIPKETRDFLIEKSEPFPDGRHPRTFQMGSYIIRSDADLEAHSLAQEEEQRLYIRGRETVWNFTKESERAYDVPPDNRCNI